MPEQPNFNRWLRLSERLALSQLRLLPPLLSRQGTSVLRYTRQLVKLPSTAQERTVLDVKVLPLSSSSNARSGMHADRRADFVTLAKENRAAEMGRFGRPFRPT